MNEVRTKHPWSRRRLVTSPIADYDESRFLYAKWTYWLCEHDLWPFSPKVSLLGYPKMIPYTKFEHFRVIRFWVMLRTNRQTNRRTRKSSVGNKFSIDRKNSCHKSSLENVCRHKFQYCSYVCYVEILSVEFKFDLAVDIIGLVAVSSVK